MTFKCVKNYIRLSTIFAFKFPGRRQFEFYDVLRLPLLLFSRSSFYWATVLRHEIQDGGAREI